MTEGDPYVELHCASAFSFLDGGTQPEALMERAAQLGMAALALADRNGVYGAARFHTAGAAGRASAHIGAEIAVRSFGTMLTPPAWLPHQHPAQPPRLLLLCASQAGYQNLCQLITRFKMREATKSEGAATLEDIAEFSAGLICLTGGDEGPLAAALAQNSSDPSRTAREIDSAHDHLRPGSSLSRIAASRPPRPGVPQPGAAFAGLLMRLPVIASNGVRYATEADRELLDVLIAIRHHTTLDKAGRLLAANAQRLLRSGRAMAALFRDIPEAIANTRIVSQRLNFTLNNLGYEFPHYPVPAGETMDSFLANASTKACAIATAPRPNSICLRRPGRRWSASSN